MVRSLYELFAQITTEAAEKTAFRVKRDGEWRPVSWGEQAREVRRISCGLLALGVEPGDRVALLASTRLEWVQCDSAIVCIGGVTVGIYHSNLAIDCEHILEHSESRIVFVEDHAQLQKVLEVRDSLPALETIVIVDGDRGTTAGVLDWRGFIEGGEGVDPARLEQIGRSLDRDSLASLVYTSGTTGTPKAAMISHGNLLFTAAAATRALSVEPHYSTLLFLPLAHVFARMIVYLCQAGKLELAFAENIGHAMANLQEVRPYFICSVPRVFEKIHERVLTAAHESGGIKHRIFRWAEGVGRRAARRRLAHRPLSPWLALQLRIADRLVLHKVRELFGGRLVLAASGAAPLNVDTNEFFQACGVNILEGLGMTENTSLSNVNRLELNKLGTVGPAIPGIEMKLADDGEILFRGPNVMRGYFKNPEATAETFDGEGWLRTGDIGTIDADGYLTITDRKKDLIITAGGKNIAPAHIEKTIRNSRFIHQVVAIGDRRKYITALITLEAETIRAWAAAQGLAERSLAALATDERVLALIDSEVQNRNRELASFESVKKFRILPRELTIEDGDLTPSLKIKRRVICEKHADLVESMYGD